MKNFDSLRVLVSGLSFLSVLMLLRTHRTIERKPRALFNVASKEPAACRVLVSNYKVNFHTEVLESILALLPIESLPLSQECDSKHVVFDFVLRESTQGKSWEQYFNDEIVNKNYNAYGETRKASNVKLVSKSFSDNIRADYDATIEASCYCKDEYIDMMKQNVDTICIFHEGCDVMAENRRAFWLSPHHKRYIFPAVLPTPPSSQTASKVTLPLDLCVIGSPGRRNFGFLRGFLDTVPRDEVSQIIKINLLGKGEYPELLKGYENLTRQESIKDFVDFQHKVASTCKVLLPLLDSKNTGDYFDTPSGHKKLTGTIVQSVSYGIPMVIHEDLATLYRLQHDSAVAWQTHTNDPKSFESALTNLVERIGNVTIAQKSHQEDKKLSLVAKE